MGQQQKHRLPLQCAERCSFGSVEAKIHSQCAPFPQVMIHITDENDCSPEFQRSIYSRDNVPETIPVGTSLLQGGDRPVSFPFSHATDLLVGYLSMFWP